MSWLVGNDLKEAAKIRPFPDEFLVELDRFGFLDDDSTVRIEKRLNRAFL
jgi:hypothetical protein